MYTIPQFSVNNPIKVQQVTHFIMDHLDFFRASLAPRPSEFFDWIDLPNNINTNLIIKISGDLREQLSKGHAIDILNDPNYPKFRQDPIACLMHGISELENNEQKEFLFVFFNCNPHGTEVLFNNISKLNEIISMWEQRNQLQQDASSEDSDSDEAVNYQDEIKNKIISHKNFIFNMIQDHSGEFFNWLQNNLTDTQKDLLSEMDDELIESDSFENLVDALKSTGEVCENYILEILENDGSLAQTLEQYLNMSEIENIIHAWEKMQDTVSNCESNLETLSVSQNIKENTNHQEVWQNRSEPKAEILAKSMIVLKDNKKREINFEEEKENIVLVKKVKC